MMFKTYAIIGLSLLASACNGQPKTMQITAEMDSQNMHCFFSPDSGIQLALAVERGQPVPTELRSPGLPMARIDGDRVMKVNYVGETIQLREIPCVVKKS